MMDTNFRIVLFGEAERTGSRTGTKRTLVVFITFYFFGANMAKY